MIMESFIYTLVAMRFFTRLTEILETTLEIHVPFSVMHYICTLYFDFGIKRINEPIKL
jgi:hypothetical protein